MNIRFTTRQLPSGKWQAVIKIGGDQYVLNDEYRTEAIAAVIAERTYILAVKELTAFVEKDGFARTA